MPLCQVCLSRNQLLCFCFLFSLLNSLTHSPDRRETYDQNRELTSFPRLCLYRWSLGQQQKLNDSLKLKLDSHQHRLHNLHLASLRSTQKQNSTNTKTRKDEKNPKSSFNFQWPRLSLEIDHQMCEVWMNDDFEISPNAFSRFGLKASDHQTIEHHGEAHGISLSLTPKPIFLLSALSNRSFKLHELINLWWLWKRALMNVENESCWVRWQSSHIYRNIYGSLFLCVFLIFIYDVFRIFIEILSFLTGF